MMKYFFLAISTITFLSVNAQDATSLYNEGIQLKDASKSAEAADKFKKALVIKPDYTAALYELGWCQNDIKQYTHAIASLRKVRESWHTVPKVFFELAYAFEKSGQADSAISMYNKCLQLKPDYSGAFRQLGYIAYEKDDNAGALAYFTKFEAAAKDSVRDYLYWYRKGFVSNALKDYSGAKASLTRSLEYRKNYTNTYLELGYACSRLKQDEEAIAHYKKAAELDPKSHVPTNGIAEVYRDNKKDRNEAMNWYKKSLAINPTERKACFGMGYCLNSQGKYSEAIPYLKTAIEKEPTYTAAYVELGYSYYQTQMQAEAEVNLKKAISLNPKNENSRYYLTLLYISQKNKAKAQQMVEELKNLSSKYVKELQDKVNLM